MISQLGASHKTGATVASGKINADDLAVVAHFAGCEAGAALWSSENRNAWQLAELAGQL